MQGLDFLTSRQIRNRARPFEISCHYSAILVARMVRNQTTTCFVSPHIFMNKTSFTFYSILFLELGIITFGAFGLLIVASPTLALAMNTPSPTQEVLWAAVHVPKPTATSVPVTSPTQEVNVPSPEAPGTAVESVDDGSLFPDEASSGFPEFDDRRWIEVNLSQQQIYVYEDDVLINSFIVSTGLVDTPTVTGEYRIYVKVPMQNMSGPGYYLTDVPWVMFFYEDYGFHGTYWHNNFGTPMSRGCVNLSVEDAAWLYDWASVGTRVSVHY